MTRLGIATGEAGEEFQQPSFWQSGKQAVPLADFAQQGAHGPVLRETQGLQAAHSPVRQTSHLPAGGAGGVGAGVGPEPPQHSRLEPVLVGQQSPSMPKAEQAGLAEQAAL